MSISDPARLQPLARSLWGDGPAGGFRHIHVARELVAPGSLFPWRRLPELVLLATRSGRALAEGRDRAVLHERRALVVLGPETEFLERVTGAKPWDVLYVTVRGPMVDAAGWNGRLAGFRPAPAPWLHALDEVAAALLTGPAPPGPRAELKAVSRLAWLLAELHDHASAEETNAPLAQQIARAVDAQPARLWRVDELARICGRRLSGFAHAFAAQTGKSPARWVRERRIEHARQWLAQGRSVSETADGLGFANPFHFSKVFKAVTGQPPSSVPRAGLLTRRKHAR